MNRRFYRELKIKKSLHEIRTYHTWNVETNNVDTRVVTDTQTHKTSTVTLWRMCNHSVAMHGDKHLATEMAVRDLPLVGRLKYIYPTGQEVSRTSGYLMVQSTIHAVTISAQPSKYPMLLLGGGGAHAGRDQRHASEAGEYKTNI